MMSNIQARTPIRDRKPRGVRKQKTVKQQGMPWLGLAAWRFTQLSQSQRSRDGQCPKMIDGAFITCRDRQLFYVLGEGLRLEEPVGTMARLSVLLATATHRSMVRIYLGSLCCDKGCLPDCLGVSRVA